MHNFITVATILLVVVSASYGIYAIATQGFKGAMFGYKILESSEDRIEYRYKGSTHSIRLHQLSNPDLYGLEVGRWAMGLGETLPLVIPREHLLELRDLIDEFIEEQVEGVV